MDVVFDLNGTLLDPGPVAEPLGAGREVALAALDEAVWTAGIDTMTGVFRPLPDLLRATLARRAWLDGLDPSPADLDAAIARAATMPAFPDARPALEHLAGAGVRLSVVTNSAADSGRAALRAAGLLDLVADVRGADEAQAYKPDPRVYALGPSPSPATWFVAGHWWDVAGASRFGHRTAWIARDDRVLAASVPAPDVRAADLLDGARAILAAA